MTNSISISELGSQQGCRFAFNRILNMSDDELAQLDIAVMNLLCATGLPSSDPLDIPECLSTLDNWAKYTYQEVFRGFAQYRANPNPNKGSENVYRLWATMHAIRALSGMEAMFMSGKKMSGPETIDSSMKPTGGPYQNRINSQVGFIHGMLNGKGLGSCSSDPVLFAAIGRRLGYPVKLVLSVQHVFNRWVDKNEQFNMDGSMRHIGSDEDHHYIDRSRPWRDAEKAALGKTLHVPLTPRQELAAFMFERSVCLSANLRFEEAKEACAIAHHISPDNPAFSEETQTIEKFIATFQRKNGVGSPEHPGHFAARPPLQNLPVIRPLQPQIVYRPSPVAGVKRVKFIYERKES